MNEHIENMEDDGIPGEDDQDGCDIANCPVCLGNKVVAGHVCTRCGGEGVIHPESELMAAERGMK